MVSCRGAFESLTFSESTQQAWKSAKGRMSHGGERASVKAPEPRVRDLHTIDDNSGTQFKKPAPPSASMRTRHDGRSRQRKLTVIKEEAGEEEAPAVGRLVCPRTSCMDLDEMTVISMEIATQHFEGRAKGRAHVLPSLTSHVARAEFPAPSADTQPALKFARRVRVSQLLKQAALQ